MQHQYSVAIHLLPHFLTEGKTAHNQAPLSPVVRPEHWQIPVPQATSGDTSGATILYHTRDCKIVVINRNRKMMKFLPC